MHFNQVFLGCPGSLLPVILTFAILCNGSFSSSCLLMCLNHLSFVTIKIPDTIHYKLSANHLYRIVIQNIFHDTWAYIWTWALATCIHKWNQQQRQKWPSHNCFSHNTQALEEDLATSSQGQERLQREKTQAEQELEEAKFSQQTNEQRLRVENEKLSKEGEELRKEVEKERAALREVTATLNSERHQHQLIKVVWGCWHEGCRKRDKKVQ